MCAVYEGGMNIVNGIGAPVDFEPLAYECDWGMSYCGDGLDFTPEQLEELRNRPFEWDSFLKDDFEYMYPRHFLACEQAKRVSKAYLRAIIEVHKATKGRGEDLYPDDLQNLLLTASRTIGIIATYLDGLPKAKSTDDSEPLGALLKDLHASESLCQEVRATARIIDPVEAISDDLRFKTFKAYERKVFMALLPLLVYYKHIK